MSKAGRKLKRILVANRGEIAVRIIRAAREYGLQSVAVYSSPDEGSQHVRLADSRVALGGASARETYLDQEKLINAAIQSGADAVHPGYGFLAENAEFAAAVHRAGLVFIGPRPETIQLMGDKNQARKKAIECQVPVVPGTEAGVSQKEIREFGKTVGYPIMIKAVAGGSGRGMRFVQCAEEIEAKLEEAQAEAEVAFKNPTVIVEKVVQKPRHIEVQVFGDDHGQTLHFGERDCSVQRRHQKIVEEAPAPNLHPAVRRRMLEAAERLVKAVSYVGAGTLEFLVEDGREENSPFYFLEMNTRIQVEHPVTELITGRDLVQLQFLVAEGKPLPWKQAEIEFSGHAFEFRVYGENPREGFKPTTGKIVYVSRAGGLGVREDSWVEAGTNISAYYDTLLAKIIVHAESREQALSRANRVLAEYQVEGLETTLGFHRWLLEHKALREGLIDVKWIEREYTGELKSALTVGPLVLPEEDHSKKKK